MRDNQPVIEYLLSCGLKLEQESIDQSQLIKSSLDAVGKSQIATKTVLLGISRIGYD